MTTDTETNPFADFVGGVNDETREQEAAQATAPEARTEAAPAQDEEAGDDLAFLSFGEPDAGDGDEADDDAADATENSAAPEQPEGDAAEDKPKRKKSVSQRIDELTRARGEAERRAEAAERRLRELERGTPAQPDPVLTKPADKGIDETSLSTKPNPQDFTFGEIDPLYIEALAQHAADAAAKRVADELRAQQESTRQADAAARIKAEVDQKYTAKVQDGLARYKDFKEVVLDTAEGETPKWPLSAETGKHILDSEVGADIAYYLATNLAAAQDLFDLGDENSPRYDPVKHAVALGRLEERIVQRRESLKKRVVSKAPQPPSQQVRGAGGKFQVGASTDDFAAFEAMAMSKR